LTGTAAVVLGAAADFFGLAASEGMAVLEGAAILEGLAVLEGLTVFGDPAAFTCITGFARFRGFAAFGAAAGAATCNAPSVSPGAGGLPFPERVDLPSGLGGSVIVFLLGRVHR
jgi:hypothetical protein